MRFSLSAATLSLFLMSSAAADPVARNVRVKDKEFVTADGSSIMLSGPNVVVKGPPYLPSVEGDTQCSDNVDADCTAAGTCEVGG